MTCKTPIILATEIRYIAPGLLLHMKGITRGIVELEGNRTLWWQLWSRRPLMVPPCHRGTQENMCSCPTLHPPVYLL